MKDKIELEIKPKVKTKTKTKPSLKVKKNFSKKRKNFLMQVFILVMAGALIGGFFGFYLSQNSFNSSMKELKEIKTELRKKNQTMDNLGIYDLEKEDNLITSIVKKNSPAVVSIVVTKDVPKIDSFFNAPFFNQFYFEDRKTEPETETQKIGGGTGFIVDKTGYIMTNRHVVNDENATYTVMLNDGKDYEAKVLAKDDFMDVAILKIDEKNLPTIKLGDSESLEIGQTVLAIGNSLGEFSNTVSRGIVSGLKRQVEAGNSLGQTEVLDEVIQTDAAINPGNSGGPLFNLRGEVIGINVAMATGAENIGFTIPINQVKDIYQSVKETGKIVRPYLGVRYIVINEKIQEMNNLLVGYGALVLRGNQRGDLAIIPGSPADKADLSEYDIILEIDGERIDEKNSLAKIIRKKQVGQEINLKVLSEGKEKNVRVVLEEADF
jgi:serine protease Do